MQHQLLLEKNYQYLYIDFGKILNKIKQEKITGKFNGTVGNFNAHTISYPNVDWVKITKEFVESFGIEYNLFTTQIESHDNICVVFSEIELLNNIILKPRMNWQKFPVGWIIHTGHIISVLYSVEKVKTCWTLTDFTLNKYRHKNRQY